MTLALTRKDVAGARALELKSQSLTKMIGRGITTAVNGDQSMRKGINKGIHIIYI